MKKNVSLIFLMLSAVAVLSTSCTKENAVAEEVDNVTPTATLKELTVNTINTNNPYLFDAPAGSDVTVSLQTALDTYKAIKITKTYLISKPIVMPSGSTLTGGGLNLGVLKAANTRSGLLSSRGVYLDLSDKNTVNVWGIKFQPADNMTNQSAYASAVILLSNAVKCNIYGNVFDFSFAYGKGMDAVWITGSGANNNLVSNNLVKTLGITYCENGASYNTVQNNQLVNSNANALGGIGNGSTACVGNQVLNNMIENAGRMGIEDQQNVVGTIISGNTVKGSGKLSGIVAGEGTGISAVAKNTIVRNNRITDVNDYYIEVGGSNKVTIINNTIFDTGKHSGIFVNFLGSAIADVTKTTIIRGNSVTGCLKGIETFGSTTTQFVTIDSNTVVDAITHAINIDAGNSKNSVILINANAITFNNKTAVTRYGIASYTRVPSGQQNYSFIISKNVFTYSKTASTGTGYDNTMIIAIDNTQINYNTINGYTGGKNYGISNNGAVTKGVTFLGNIVNSAIWNLLQFLK